MYMAVLDACQKSSVKFPGFNSDVTIGFVVVTDDNKKELINDLWNVSNHEADSIFREGMACHKPAVIVKRFPSEIILFSQSMAC